MLLVDRRIQPHQLACLNALAEEATLYKVAASMLGRLGGLVDGRHASSAQEPG